MTNSKALRELIATKGLKLKYVAEVLGITYYALQQKINNVREFKTSEVASLCSLLDITSLNEKERLFFAKEVDCKSTNNLSKELA